MSEHFQIILPRAFPEAVGSGIVKQSPEDFIVNEVLGFSFTGKGEHIYLRLRKVNQNTMWVVGLLAKHFHVKQRDIGYAGMKDRHAVTTQWFSLPAREITQDKIASFACDNVEIMDVQRHSGKLRKGAIKLNEFKLTIRELDVDEAVLDERLQLIMDKGVPNYFDEQRFGRERQNLSTVNRLFSGELQIKRSKQRIYLSAARSWLFNLILAERVNAGCWCTGLDGDVFMLNGSKKYFHTEKMDETLVQRLVDKDIHPTIALWGKGRLETSSRARELEMSILQNWQAWCSQLEKAGMQQQRRASRVVPVNLRHRYSRKKQMLELSFALPAGAYATNVLKEIIQIEGNQFKSNHLN